VGQLGFEGMPKRLYACTPSRLTTWLDCPRRYRMTYLDRPPPQKGPPWAHNSLGASVHNALAGWWRLPRRRRVPAEVGTLLDAGWLTDGYRDPRQSEEWRARARELVVRYAGRLDPDDEPLGVERTVAARTETLALSGRVDRIDARVGEDGAEELVVVDYKTGRRSLSTDDARGSLALAVYAVAAARSLRRRCSRVELHHLPRDEVHAWEHTPETLGRHVRRAEAVAAEAQEADARFAGGLPPERYDEAFPPRPGAQCAWCDFARHCPEGSAGYPPKQPWDGLSDGWDRPPAALAGPVGDDV
jgi:RecB family exonuclease